MKAMRYEGFYFILFYLFIYLFNFLPQTLASSRLFIYVTCRSLTDAPISWLIRSNDIHSFTMPQAIPPQRIILPELGEDLKKRVAYPDRPRFPPSALNVADAVALCHEVYDAYRQSYQACRMKIADVFHRGQEGNFR